MALRVISGTAGGLCLQSPKKHALRPTQDRIRQVIFSSLAARVPGSRVLDLYAGTGAIGIEALSRGAAGAVFVEQEAEAIACIRKNLAGCRLTGEVRQLEVGKFLAGAPEPFDLIFADPPYDKARLPSALAPAFLAQLPAWLTPDGLFIWEHFADQPTVSAPAWEVVRHRRYGETGLSFFKLK